MDQLPPSLPAPKTRRKYSREFKTKVLKECQEPGSSTAGVARRYGLNANLIHKWRRHFEKQGTDSFIALPAPAEKTTPSAVSGTIRLELPNGAVVHWPADRMMESVPWLKALQS